MLKAATEPYGVAAAVESITHADEGAEIGQRNVRKQKLNSTEYA